MLHLVEAELHAVKLWSPNEEHQVPLWLLEALSDSPGPGATGVALSDYLENKLLDHTLSATAFTSPTSIITALYTAAPSDTGGGTEVTGGAYARVTLAANTTNYPAASGGTKSNGVDVNFGTATADWGTVTHVAEFDQSGINLLFWGALTSSRLVKIGDSFKFAATKLVHALD